MRNGELGLAREDESAPFFFFFWRPSPDSHHQMVGKAALASPGIGIRVAESILARGAPLFEGEEKLATSRPVVPQQHTIERVGCGDELAAVLGEDHLVDQGIDRRILDADIVLRAVLVG